MDYLILHKEINNEKKYLYILNSINAIQFLYYCSNERKGNETSMIIIKYVEDLIQLFIQNCHIFEVCIKITVRFASPCL